MQAIKQIADKVGKELAIELVNEYFRMKPEIVINERMVHYTDASTFINGVTWGLTKSGDEYWRRLWCKFAE